MRTKNTVVVCLLCFLLAVFAVSHAKEAADPILSAAPSPYPVVDSGVWADWENSPDMYWLDDQRVIFLGTETDPSDGDYLERAGAEEDQRSGGGFTLAQPLYLRLVGTAGPAYRLAA